MSLRTKVAASVVAIAAAFSLTACGGDDDNTIKIGTTDQSQEQWQVFEKEATAAGLDVEIVSFNDYNLPNRALQDGEIDVNNFQHLMFLANYNVGANANLVPVGATEIVPLALYYKDHSDVKDVIAAGEIAIPNDQTNQARALHMLSAAGLIKLKDDKLLTPTPADIDEGQSKVKVTPVDAAQTVTSYQDGTPAVINNSFLDRGHIDPKTAVAKDDPSSPEAQPYINAFVTTEEHKNDPELKRLVEVWHSQPVQDAINRQSNGTSVEVKMDGDKLADILKQTEEKVRKEGK